ncbi:MAG: hypothetical protein KF858_02600 [Candidatus Sumerlaeia bacterium]|nr:hypothetical protein [Candidatus Sumerlaeia bacterium]
MFGWVRIGSWKQRAAALCGLLAGMVALATAAPPDLTGRQVLLDGAAKSAAASVEAPAHFDPTRTAFALYAKLDVSAPPPVVRLDGEPLGMVPVPGEAGEWLLPLPGARLAQGPVALSIEAPDGTPLPAERLLVFELLDGAEEMHFGRLFGARSAAEKATPPEHPSQRKYDVLHYDLDLDVSMTSRALSGVVTIRLKALESNLSQIGLDFQSDGVLLVSSVVAVPAIAGLTHSVDGTNKWLVVNLPAGQALAAGQELTLRVTYAGTPSSSAGAFGLNSYNRTTQPTNGKPIVYTFSEPYSARSWWPCKDLPYDKATVDLRITVDNPNFVVTNGVLASTTAVSGSRTRYHYTHAYPVATYLVAFCATEYAYGSGMYTSRDGATQMEVGHYVYLNSLGELAAVPDTIDVMEFFAGTFGEYPFLSEKYVTMTWGGGFGMEHQTATSINNGNLASGGKSRRNVHELAHQWFGNQVTPTSFDHLWLNEGWATYCEALYVEHDQGFNAYKAAIAAWISSGTNNTTPMVNSNADAFQTSLVYRKGGLVLHMLRHVMGDEDFFEGTREYLRRFDYGVVETDDFREVMEDVSGLNLGPFFQQWVYGTGRPEYQWDWRLDGTNLNVYIHQTQSGQVFTLPIDIVATLSGGGLHTFVANTTQRTQSFTFDTTGLNITGVSFDPDNWVYKASLTRVTIGAPKPTLLTARRGTGPGQMDVTWVSGGAGTAGFELSVSNAITGTSIVADSSVLGASATSHTVTGLDPGTTWYVKLRAVGTSTFASDFGDVYAVRLGTGVQPRALIVDGNDRYELRQQVGISHSFAARHGTAMGAAGMYFDACANEAMGAPVALSTYRAVVLALGEESTQDRTFAPGEEALVRAYLDAGGQLFVSGAEIGWDIGRSGAGNPSLDFYNNYLKASFVADNSQVYTVTGEPASAFAGLSFGYGSGDSPYFPAWPDQIAPAGGGSVALRYDETKIAAVQYAGTFGTGTVPGRVVYLGFPFETINTASDRQAVMERVAVFFQMLPTPAQVGEQWMVY